MRVWGRFGEKLVSLGLDRKTLVLFFSDNGAAAYDFPSGSPELRGNKGSVYEGGHKVPFIAWWPGKIEAGSENDAPAITLDIMPTLLSLAGLEPPADRPLDGVDLSPVLLKQQRVPRTPARSGPRLATAAIVRKRCATAHGSWSSIIPRLVRGALRTSRWSSTGSTRTHPRRPIWPASNPIERPPC